MVGWPQIRTQNGWVHSLLGHGSSLGGVPMINYSLSLSLLAFSLVRRNLWRTVHILITTVVEDQIVIWTMGWLIKSKSQGDCWQSFNSPRTERKQMEALFIHIALNHI